MQNDNNSVTAVDERKLFSPDQLDAELTTVLAEIRSVYEPEKVVLFGTAAQGRPWHDLDLLVIANTEDEFYDRLVRIAELFSKGPHTPTDVIVATPDEFARAVADHRFFVIHEILEKGRVVYERSAGSGVAKDC